VLIFTVKKMITNPCFRIKVTTDKEAKEGILPTDDCLKVIGKSLKDVTQNHMGL
jgi:hypothetical protein